MKPKHDRPQIQIAYIHVCQQKKSNNVWKILELFKISGFQLGIFE
jgi:hypothetical protein